MMYKVIIFAALVAVVACQAQSALDRLVVQMNACDNKFLCQLNTTRFSCDVECIDTVKMCNGKKECTNGADELNCPTTRCPNEVICRDRHTCAKPCDGTPQCAADMEDEAGCPPTCTAGLLLCNDRKKCAKPCDTTVCPQGENVWNCGKTCPANMVLCNDLETCASVCNGVRECPTAEDEACPFQCFCKQGDYICLGNEKRCIDRTKVCNEVTFECPLGDDETDGGVGFECM